MTSPTDPPPPRGEAELVRLAGLLRGSGREFEAVVQGVSMGAALTPGSSVLIKCIAAADVPAGAIVAFVAGDGIVSHRVAFASSSRRGGRWLLTHGDADWLCDPPCSPERVVGVVVGWRTHAAEGWRPVPAPHSNLHGPASRVVRRAIWGALHLHVWFARALYTVLYLSSRACGVQHPRALG